jgi:hypothetical protein
MPTGAGFPHAASATASGIYVGEWPHLWSAHPRNLRLQVLFVRCPDCAAIGIVCSQQGGAGWETAQGGVDSLVSPLFRGVGLLDLRAT